ncbi:HK97 family phage prohead protease [Bradyrhizobium sp. LB11.1]|uniref:HK97 family phage prohead protease n=1 Tax=Bradyrhizobium sp. LB11.1 TaxID=3156326 RepID=UPI00339715A7
MKIDKRIYDQQTRKVDTAPQPSTFNREERSVHCVISMGSPVKRFYGTEELEISAKAVDLSRMKSGGIPLLDSHNQNGIDNHLGRFTQTWFSRGALMGKIVFNETERGRMAMGMVERGEIAGISAGYVVSEWRIKDADGKIIDPETTRISLDDNLTFIASRWELLEASLVSVPADASASIRSLASELDNAALRMTPYERRGQDEETVDAAEIKARVRRLMLDGLCREKKAQRANRLDDLWLRRILIKDDRARRGVK